MPARRLSRVGTPPSVQDLKRNLEVAEGRVLIRLKAPSSSRAAISGIASAVDRAQATEAIGVLRTQGVRIDHVFANIPVVSAQITEADLERLLALDIVDYIEAHAGGKLEGLPSLSSSQDTTWGVSFVRAPDAWAPRTGLGNRGNFATVTMLDSGLDSLHLTVGDGPASASFVTCYFVNLAGVPTPDSQTGCKSLSSHGPHIAGIINAADNEMRFLGVAPELMRFNSIRVCQNVSPYNCTQANVAEALDWVASYGGTRHIVNMSLGFCWYSSVLDEAAQSAIEAGALLVASSGNRWSDDPDCANQSNQLSITDIKWPARFPGVLSVGGIMSDSSTPTLGPNPGGGSSPPSGGPDCGGTEVCMRLPQPCPVSGYGSRYGSGVDLVAPFESWSLGRWDPTIGAFASGNSHYCGTSQSAAFVTGVAALLWTRHPGYSADQVKQQLRTSARQVGTMWIVDAWRAAQLAPLVIGVSINGPTVIESEGGYTWTTTVTNAQSAPTFSWSYSTSEFGNYTPVGTNSSYSQFVGSGPPPEFWLRVQASDHVSSSTSTIHVSNNAVNPCYPLVCLQAPIP